MIAVVLLLCCATSAAQPSLRGIGNTEASTGFSIANESIAEPSLRGTGNTEASTGFSIANESVAELTTPSTSKSDGNPVPARFMATTTCWGTSCIIEGDPCHGDDCSSEAACPVGSSLIDCESEPADAGDGIQVESGKCIARGAAAPSNRRRSRRRSRHSIKAIASCSSASTSVVVSGTTFLDNQEVSASCPEDRNVLSCYCHSAWSSSVCGGTTEFLPEILPGGSICKKTIGSSPGRRRTVDGGAGAKVYALCSAPRPTTLAPTTTPAPATTTPASTCRRRQATTVSQCENDQRCFSYPFGDPGRAGCESYCSQACR